MPPLWVSSAGSGGPATVSIKDASGAVLSGGTGNLGNAVGPVTLPTTGTYTIEVDPNNEGAGVVAFHLTTLETSVAASTAVGTDPPAPAQPSNRSQGPLPPSQCGNRKPAVA